MKEILLYKSKDSIVANRIVNILDINNIAYRQHDETMDKRPGAYGPIPGISIYVFEKDYDRALELIDPVIKDNIQGPQPFCPKCGSKEVEIIPRPKYTKIVILLAVLLFLIPGLYFVYSRNLEIRSNSLDIIAIALLLSSIALMILSKYQNVNHQCKTCGRKFNHI